MESSVIGCLQVKQMITSPGALRGNGGTKPTIGRWIARARLLPRCITHLLRLLWNNGSQCFTLTTRFLLLLVRIEFILHVIVWIIKTRDSAAAHSKTRRIFWHASKRPELFKLTYHITQVHPMRPIPSFGVRLVHP